MSYKSVSQEQNSLRKAFRTQLRARHAKTEEVHNFQPSTPAQSRNDWYKEEETRPEFEVATKQPFLKKYKLKESVYNLMFLVWFVQYTRQKRQICLRTGSFH
jgi:hypothetical protein